MRRLITLVLLLVSGAYLPSQEVIVALRHPTTGTTPIALIAHTKIAGTSGGTTGTINTTGGTLIVIVASNYNVSPPVIPTPTDSKSNTYVQAGSTYYSSPANVAIFYKCGPTVGTGHTFTLGGTFSAIEVLVFSGTKISGCYDTGTGNQSASAHALGTGTATPTVNNDVCVAGHGAYLSPNETTTTQVSPSQTFTVTDFNPSTAGTNIGSSGGYYVQSTAAGLSTTVTTDSSDISDGFAAILQCFEHS